MRPKRVCSHPGCPVRVSADAKTRGRCPEHARAHERSYQELRGTAAERGYDARWRRYSLHLRRTELILCGDRLDGLPPTGDSLCRAAQRVQPAELVDHIVPVTGPNDPRWYERANLQGACWRCHQVKRQREQQAGRGRA